MISIKIPDRGLLFAVLFALVIPHSGAEPASFDSATGQLTLPEVLVDGQTYTNTVLLLSLDGRYQILSFTPPALPEKCGTQTCSSGLMCCNASCGICAPPGGVCIQIACE